jgi:hypothetical protein
MYKHPEAMQLFPIFLAISSMGGIIAGYYRHKDLINLKRVVSAK